MMADQLARHGYRVVEAESVEQTIAAAQDGVEAIVLDTSLDGMNGWEILPLLRRKDPESHTPIVLLSVATRRRRRRLAAQMPRAWFTKPVEDDALLAELARVLCGPGERARILVVEDDVDLAQVIGQIFSRDTIDVHAGPHAAGGAGCVPRASSRI